MANKLSHGKAALQFNPMDGRYASKRRISSISYFCVFIFPCSRTYIQTVFSLLFLFSLFYHVPLLHLYIPSKTYRLLPLQMFNSYRNQPYYFIYTYILPQEYTFIYIHRWYRRSHTRIHTPRFSLLDCLLAHLTSLPLCSILYSQRDVCKSWVVVQQSHWM